MNYVVRLIYVSMVASVISICITITAYELKVLISEGFFIYETNNPDNKSYDT